MGFYKGYKCLTQFSTLFSYIMASTFIVINRTPLNYYKSHRAVSNTPKNCQESSSELNYNRLIEMLYCGCMFRLKNMNK